MTTTESQNPWQELEKLVERSDHEGMGALLDALPPDEAARAVSRLDEDVQQRLLQSLEPRQAAELVDRIPDPQATALIERLEPDAAAAIVQELPSNKQADLLADLAGDNAEAILTAMEPARAEGARALRQYPPEVAGGLMITEYLSYDRKATVADVISDLRANAHRYRNYDVQYAYVTDDDKKLDGVLRLRDLLLSRPGDAVRDLEIRTPITIPDSADLDHVHTVFERHPFFGIPVVDPGGRLVGVVRRAAVQEALTHRADSDFRKSQGIIGGEELRTMPITLRAKRRLAWLCTNIVLNVIAASVIALYQETLAAVIALAVFLPIVSDMSGCSGNQAVAVSIRELTLGLVRPVEILRVWLREISVGAINGLVLGVLIALVAWAWKGNPWLGLVVGAAMMLNTMVAVSVGGAVPLILRRMNKDPALASGPILTTITDVCGFFFVLSFAAAMMPWLK